MSVEVARRGGKKKLSNRIAVKKRLLEGSFMTLDQAVGRYEVTFTMESVLRHRQCPFALAFPLPPGGPVGGGPDQDIARMLAMGAKDRWYPLILLSDSGAELNDRRRPSGIALCFSGGHNPTHM